MQKIHRNYFVINGLQIVCKHTKSKLYKTVKQHLEKNNAGLEKEEDVHTHHSHSNV
jgi:hypothetical protein